MNTAAFLPGTVPKKSLTTVRLINVHTHTHTHTRIHVHMKYGLHIPPSHTSCWNTLQHAAAKRANPRAYPTKQSLHMFQAHPCSHTLHCYMDTSVQKILYTLANNFLFTVYGRFHQDRCQCLILFTTRHWLQDQGQVFTLCVLMTVPLQ